MDFHACAEVKHLCHLVGCARDRHQSHTEVEVISLDAGLRKDGIPALNLCDLVMEVFRSSPNQL